MPDNAQVSKNVARAAAKMIQPFALQKLGRIGRRKRSSYEQKEAWEALLDLMLSVPSIAPVKSGYSWEQEPGPKDQVESRNWTFEEATSHEFTLWSHEDSVYYRLLFFGSANAANKSIPVHILTPTGYYHTHPTEVRPSTLLNDLQDCCRLKEPIRRGETVDLP